MLTLRSGVTQHLRRLYVRNRGSPADLRCLLERPNVAGKRSLSVALTGVGECRAKPCSPARAMRKAGVLVLIARAGCWRRLRS